MSLRDGGMRTLLRFNLPDCKVALNIENWHLVCWATIDFLDCAGRRPNIMAYTKSGHRCLGYAQETVEVLLRRSKAPEKVTVFTSKMCNLMKNIVGYTAFYPHEDVYG